MAVVGQIPRGGGLVGGGGALHAEPTSTNRRGYPPMSNVGELTRARKIDTAPSLKYSSPNLDNRQPVISTPLIPLPETEHFDFLYPSKFEPDASSLALVRAPKIFLEKKIDESSAPEIASRLLAYFSRPLAGTYEETVFYREGPQQVRRPYRAPLPLLSEFAGMNGFTERELKLAAKHFPELGRALEFAKDVMKTNLIRGGLTQEYNPAMVQFTATNETDMKVKSEQTVKNVNMNDLLDRIEQATEPQSYDI